jgi:hypothetical protein
MLVKMPQRMAKTFGIKVTGTIWLCDTCALANGKQKNVSKEASALSKKLGERLYVDISSVSLVSIGGIKFMAMIADDYTHYKLDSEVKQLGITIEFVAPNTPQQNGVAEQAIANRIQLVQGNDVGCWLISRVERKTVGGFKPFGLISYAANRVDIVSKLEDWLSKVIDDGNDGVQTVLCHLRSSSHASSRSGGDRLVTRHIIYKCYVIGGSLYIVGGCLCICGAYAIHSQNRPMTPAWESKMDIRLFMHKIQSSFKYHNS